jgi:hypothetical protein
VQEQAAQEPPAQEPSARELLGQRLADWVPAAAGTAERELAEPRAAEQLRAAERLLAAQLQLHGPLGVRTVARRPEAADEVQLPPLAGLGQLIRLGRLIRL